MKFILFHPCVTWEYSFIQHCQQGNENFSGNVDKVDGRGQLSKYMAVYGGDDVDGNDGSVDGGGGGDESVYGIDGGDDIDGGGDEKCKLGLGESVRLTSFPW